jgi:hypothetical protein
MPDRNSFVVRDNSAVAYFSLIGLAAINRDNHILAMVPVPKGLRSIFAVVQAHTSWDWDES